MNNLGEIRTHAHTDMGQSAYEDGGAQSAKSGSWNGLQVTAQHDATSALADAAEELTMAGQEKEEKKLTERKLKQQKGSPRTMLDRINRLLGKFNDLNKDVLQRFMETMLAGVKNQTQLKELLGKFQDPTHQHAALTLAREQLQGKNPDTLKMIDQTLKDLETEKGEQIRAGYNIADVDGGGLADQAALRKLYRATILDYQSLLQAFDDLSEKYASKDFAKAIDFLMRALGADMAATTPSTTMEQLQGIMNDLYQLEVLSQFYTTSEALLAHLREFCQRELPASAKDIMRPVLQLKDENFLTAMQITRQMPFLVSDEPPCDVQFIQRLRQTVQKLPHRFFMDGQKRQNLLDAMQEILDEAIDREEGEFE